ncbi:MAG TPA: hypothetical protein VLB29_18650 [Nocardioidaceae bacterium]|nr:hypothetical protein [Nocardioidaceae bacterium]
MDDDEQAPWYRSLLVGVGALLGVAVLVGGVIAVIAVGAVNLAGIGDAESSARAEPSLYIPERTSEGTQEDDDGLTLEDLNGGKSPTESESAEPKPEPSKSPKEEKRKPKPPPSVISLSASPVEVSRMERIYLSGSYPRGEGASLQVQRLEGGVWRDFPTSASVSGGTFSTYVMTGQSGLNKFRVVDSAKGKKSNPVSVRVR